MELSLSSRQVGDYTVLHVSGEVDVYTAPTLRERLFELENDGARKVIVDLGGVDFLDSTGLGVLVGACKRLDKTGGTFSLVCTRKSVLKIFQITALDRFMPVYDTVDNAIDQK